MNVVINYTYLNKFKHKLRYILNINLRFYINP